ncbi:RNA 2',3'-cyclic phosphodiesterase [Pontibacter cellulosilyticus]|uniref:RNA 2',3'-cyclic phosphodiesterase n=1 Tax=Pontibacter cellulosilyticus TaxID=1720253 RepID=A0A923N748_9BACT|nr:RNA 2',3'-cyclic phosphodiesterase [Pontibacter cellulosilyticus]MBC5993456.1 RNA 2',3'-cyclic phosphodiesterase [Pontibacter cellulosilyticus]
MKDNIRLFIAAILPESLKDTLQEQLTVFEHPHIRVIPKQNLHLTLYFIGNVPHSQLESIRQTIQDVARQHQPFTLTFAQTEPGPTQRKPRLVWARFEQDPVFENLSQQLTEKLSEEAAPAKKPIPHVTLARFRKDKPAPKDLPDFASQLPLELHVNVIALFQSELGTPHPIYSVLDAYPLG